MKLIIKGKNLRVTKALSEHAQKKFNKLDAFFENIIEGTLEIEIEKGSHADKHKAHIVIKLPRHVVLTGEAKTNDMYNTINELEAKMSTVIKKQHKKFKTHKVKSNRNIFKKVFRNINNAVFSQTEQSETNTDIHISVETRLKTKPMDPVEAVLQLSKTKLQFYTFHNTKVHHQLNVVYKRPDGTYGLQTDKKQYIKRANLKNFKNQPVKTKKQKNLIKITKIKEINKTELSLEKAVDRLLTKKDYHFFSFKNKENGNLNIIYKVSPTKIKVIEPTIVS